MQRKHKQLGLVVTVKSRGHWPDTALVVLPDGRVIEVYIKDLE